MGYIELKGTNQSIAQDVLKSVLDHDDTVTMIVLGLNSRQIAQKARNVANQEPNTWYAVWVQNMNLLTSDQLTAYQKGNSRNVVCVLSRDDKPIVFLQTENAIYEDQLLEAFFKAGVA